MTTIIDLLYFSNEVGGQKNKQNNLISFYLKQIGSIHRNYIMQIIQYNAYALISVTDPVLQLGSNTNATPYVTYLISGKDPHGEFFIRRRFRQFDLLRQKLVERFIGVYIPPIPSKKASGNTEERFVEQRRRFLNYFCLKIASKPFLFDSDIFQTFIRGDPDFERAVRFISGEELALIANIYDVEYRQIAEELNITRIEAEIESERKTLMLVHKKLTEIRQEMRKMMDIKKDFIKQYSKCFLGILPRYQQEFLSKHFQEQPQQYIYFDNLPFKERINEYAHFSAVNPLLDYIQSITYDIREVRALLEAIQTRKTFENKKMSVQTAFRQNKEELQKLQNGRMSIKSIFTPGTKEAQIKQLEDSIPYYQRNEAFLQMCLPFSAVSIHQDIHLFKKSRSLDYLGTLQVIAQKQMRILDLHGSMLKTIRIKLDPQPNVPESVAQQAQKTEPQEQSNQNSV